MGCARTWLGMGLSVALMACGGGDSPSELDRVLVYYLPYDNDLAPQADAVIDALARNVTSEHVAVVALVDRDGTGGLERHEITRDEHRVERLASDASSAPSTLRRLLDHSASAFPARRYAVFLLGHGGAEDHWAYDATPGGGEPWMALSDAAAVLRAFRMRPDVDVDLVFLQQCGRAAMPTLSSFAGTADVVMASQTVVGAPNRYYGGLLAHLAVAPRADGETLARLVMNHEDPTMFADYVAFRGDALGEMSERVDGVLSPLLSRPGLVPAGTGGTDAPTVTYRWGAEVHVDLLQWLDGLHRANGVDATPVQDLRRWLFEEAIVDRRVSPPHERLGRNLCGVNIPLSA